MEDEVLSVLGSIGYRGIPSRDKLSSKDKLIKYVIYVIQTNVVGIPAWNTVWINVMAIVNQTN